MSKSKRIASAVMTSLLTTSIANYTTHAVAATSVSPMEKCYGIAKKAKNDCGTPTHACAGQATVNNDPNEWVYVPLGSCVKTPGGSLTPKGESKTSS